MPKVYTAADVKPDYKPQGYTVAILNGLPEIHDLGIAARNQFMKALIAEDKAGYTTPEAEAFLQAAVEKL